MTTIRIKNRLAIMTGIYCGILLISFLVLNYGLDTLISRNVVTPPSPLSKEVKGVFVREPVQDGDNTLGFHQLKVQMYSAFSVLFVGAIAISIHGFQTIVKPITLLAQAAEGYDNYNAKAYPISSGWDELNRIIMNYNLMQMKFRNIHQEFDLKVQQRTEELEIMRDRFERLATMDELTGIYNRRKASDLLNYEFSRAIRQSNALSLIMIDIDHFKRVNDRYGHQRGDEVLEAVANIMKEHIRIIDYVARWGGEEFLVICPSTDVYAAKEVAERIRLAIETDTLPWGGCTVSCGVSAISRKDGGPSDLLNRADQGLYHAKTHGRNRVEVLLLP